MEISENTDSVILNKVRADLNPSRKTAYLKTFFAVSIGGSLSLFVCGQFGYGGTEFAENLFHQFHTMGNGLLCYATCGFLFSLIPLLFLRIISHPLQFRAILKKPDTIAIWLVVFALALNIDNQLAPDLFSGLVWLGTCMASFEALGILFHALEKKMKPAFASGF